MTKIQDITDPYVAGDYLDLVVTVLDKDGETVDISNIGSIRYGIMKTDSAGGPSGPPVILKTLIDGVALTDAANGVFTVTLDSGDTDLLRGTYYHEAEIIDENDNVSTIFIGQFYVKAQGLLPVV